MPDMTPEWPPLSVQFISREVAALLKERKETVSIAETAAGGLISASILANPGTSAIYKGGLTLYTLESRLAFAGWTQEDTQQYGGPTPAIVTKLAENVRKTLGSTYTVSESGTAGPTASGTTPNRQPGYVALAVATDHGTYTKELNTGTTDREQNMLAFAVEALNLLKDVIQGTAKL